MWKKSLYSIALLTPGKIQSAYYNILILSDFLFVRLYWNAPLMFAWNQQKKLHINTTDLNAVLVMSF